MKAVLFALAIILCLPPSARSQTHYNAFSLTGTIVNNDSTQGSLFLRLSDGNFIGFYPDAMKGNLGPFGSFVGTPTEIPTVVQYGGGGYILWQWGASANYTGESQDYGGSYSNYSVNVSGTIPVIGSFPSAQNQDPKIHRMQQKAAVAEPVDMATGYLWYANTLLKESGAQDLIYGISGKFGGLVGADFGATYDLSIRIDGVLVPGRPCITLSQAGCGIHHYYDTGTVGYHSEEFGASKDWIEVIGSSGYIIHRPDQSQLVFATAAPAAGQTFLSGYLTAIVNSHGQQIQIARSSTNAAQITSVTEAISGQSFTYQYDLNGVLTTVTDNLGRQVIYSYGSTPGMPVQVQVVSETGTVVKSLSFTYDSNGNLTALVDKEGRLIMQNSYDTLGRVLSQQDGRGTTTHFHYQLNSDGMATTTVEDRNGANTVYSFDSNLLLLKKVNPTVSVTQSTMRLQLSCGSHRCRRIPTTTFTTFTPLFA